MHQVKWLIEIVLKNETGNISLSDENKTFKWSAYSLHGIVVVMVVVKGEAFVVRCDEQVTSYDWCLVLPLHRLYTSLATTSYTFPWSLDAFASFFIISNYSLSECIPLYPLHWSYLSDAFVANLRINNKLGEYVSVANLMELFKALSNDSSRQQGQGTPAARLTEMHQFTGRRVPLKAGGARLENAAFQDL